MPPFSGLFDNEFDDGPHSLQFNRPSARRNVARLFRKRSMAALRELIVELTGTAAGAAALVQKTRVKHEDGLDEFGGQREVETVDILNRNTAAADATDIDTAVIVSPTAIAPSAYPVDRSGNGGGGRAGV